MNVFLKLAFMSIYSLESYSFLIVSVAYIYYRLMIMVQYYLKIYIISIVSVHLDLSRGKVENDKILVHDGNKSTICIRTTLSMYECSLKNSC